MASIVQKEGKTGVIFQVRYRVNGKQKAKNFASKGKNITAIREAEREAKKFLKEIEAKLTLDEVKDSDKVKLKDYAWTVLKIKSISLKWSTLKFYEYYFRQVLDGLGHYYVSDLKPHIIDLFLFESYKNKSHRVVANYMLVLNMIFNSAVKDDLIEHNPMHKIKFELPKKEKKKKAKPITDEKIRILLSYAEDKEPHYSQWIRLVYNTGMRVSESLAIKHSDFDYEKRIYYVNKSRDRRGDVGPTKTYKPRIGIIHTALEELMSEIKMYQNEMKRLFGEYYNDNDLVICQSDGTPLSYWAIKSFLDRFYSQTGVKITAHELRHTFISKLIVKENLNPKVVQKLAGHAKITTTLDVYTDLIGDQFEEEVFEALDEAFADEYIKV